MGDSPVPFPGLIKLPVLAAQHSRRLVYAAFVFVAGGVSIGTISAVAYWSGHPLVVPSLGPTAFLVFNRSQSVAARPRNAVLGHSIGAAAGYLALLAFGLNHGPSVVQGGMTAPRIGAAALSIAVTSAVMILLRVEHGPAGATTLIVSLGFMTSLASLALLMAGVIALVAEGVLIDRLAGLQLPYWSDRKRPSSRLRRGLGHLRPFTADLAGIDGESPRRSLLVQRPESQEPVSRSVVRPGEGRRIQVGGAECTVKVDRAPAAGSYALLEVVLDPRQPSTLLHVHCSFTETYWVLDGEVSSEIDGEQVRAGPGSVISVPAGVPHFLNCAGRMPARCLCITGQGAQSHPEFLP
jgi:CBS domain-containing membrane protein